MDRVAEIAAIFEDIERRRLQAIFDQDEAAFRAVHANDEYEEESLVAMDLVVVTDPNAVRVEILEVFVDTPTCIAVEATWDRSTAIEGGGIASVEQVLERRDDGWGYSWVGTGWRCDGSHPLAGS
jgi:hypothetical protein